MTREIDDRAHRVFRFGVLDEKNRHIGVDRSRGTDDVGIADARICLIRSVFHQIYAVE